MDWFESLLGFREGRYEDVQAQLSASDGRLHSKVNGASYAIGAFEVLSLQTLRSTVRDAPSTLGRLTVRSLAGDARKLHSTPEFAGALFQVASQFNVLEMVSPGRTPEDGVTAYASDRTQGPACAIAAGAATVYRNYLLPLDGRLGQTADRQVDTLRALGGVLAAAVGLPLHRLWRMQNGYALCSDEGLAAIDTYLATLGEAELDRLRERLEIGIHWDVEVTDSARTPRPIVSQAFCSALPVAYSPLPKTRWGRFAQLVLEAAYEATLHAAVCQVQRGGSSTVLLTRLGGGAFGNAEAWIDQAMTRALELFADHPLDVRIVSYGPPAAGTLLLSQRYPFRRQG